MNKVKRNHITRTLLIEDDPNDVVLIEKFLRQAEDHAFDIETCSGLNAAIKKLSAGNTDLVLLDLALPDGQGLGTFQRLHTEFPEIPVVILTGLDDKNIAFEAISQGAQDYLVKDQISTTLLSRTIDYAHERNRIRKELDDANARLEHLMTMDPLTGLLNRRGLQQVLSEMRSRGQRFGSSSHAFLLDLDDFKQINDTFGYVVGDLVLKKVGDNIKSALRASDYLARVGGDEFVVVLPEAREGEAMAVAQKIRREVCNTPIGVSMGKTIKMTTSIGIVALMNGVMSVDELLEKSHLALRRSKQMGKNMVTQGQTPGSFKEDDVSASSVLYKGELFYAVQQPILKLEDQTKVAYELLSRLTHGEFELPGDFFHLAREENMLTFVDHICLRVCLAACHRFNPAMRAHVNLFPATLIDLPIEQLLEEFQIAKSTQSLCLEISEQQLIGDPTYLVDATRALKKAGILVAMDDVGFGSSCLESIILLEPEIVKIDRKYIKDLDRDEGKVRSIKRILRVIESCEADAIAEGIETREELRILMDLGVKYGQGFLFGKPSRDFEPQAL